MTSEPPLQQTPPDGGAYTEHVRNALMSLLPDEALREKTVLKIQTYMNSGWNYPETSGFFGFEGKVNRIVFYFASDGLTREAYLRAAAQKVTLFYQNPETLIGNIERVAHHFREDGLTLEAYLKAAGSQPSLFFRKPATIRLSVPCPW